MSNYYFTNDEVQGWIEEYLSFPLDERKELPYTLQLREKILREVSKIINGIIFTHHFTVWEPYDDLFQEAAEACIKALEKFNPNYITSSGEKATAFNYFSLTAKRCLKFYTIRNKKNRNNYQLEDQTNNLPSMELFFSNKIVIENFIKELTRIFNVPKKNKLLDLIDILDDYLHKMGQFNKRDFFRFAKFYGWSPNLIRKFLKIIGDNQQKLYSALNVKIPEIEES